MSKIRVGIIGIGHLGTFHSKIYSQLSDVEVSFLADTDLEKARDKASEKLNIQATTEMGSLKLMR